jgi:glycosyltransferase involved in cell wall biosynthesis
MISKPLITVLLPIYNCEKYIFDAINSVLQQTYSIFELLIIDDCSTDNTLKIAESFQDARINIIKKEKNSGYTNSLNLGIKFAKGKYIARMDGDDVSLPERFEKQVAFLEKNADTIVCGCWYQILGTEQIIKKPTQHEKIKLEMLRESAIGHPTAMLRNSILQENKILYDTNFEPAEDYNLWVRLLAFGKFANIDEVLFLYRNHDSQISETSKNRQRKLGTESRWKMLNYLKLNLSINEEKSYKKIYSFTDKFTFQDIKIILILLKKLSIQNGKLNYFMVPDFNLYLSEIEMRIINQYFLANKKYSPKVILQYLQLIKKISYRIPNILLVKVLLKSLIFYKKN